MCYWKVAGAKGVTNFRDNFSGYYFVGNQTNTSLTLRCAYKETIAQSDMISVYIDCALLKTKTLPPSWHFHKRIRDINPHAELHSDLGIHGTLCYAITQKKALGLFIDNLPDVYCSQNQTWGEISALVTSLQAAVFATGDPALLTLLVERADAQKIRMIKNCVLPALNATKISKFPVM